MHAAPAAPEKYLTVGGGPGLAAARREDRELQWRAYEVIRQLDLQALADFDCGCVGTAN